MMNLGRFLNPTLSKIDSNGPRSTTDQQAARLVKSDSVQHSENRSICNLNLSYQNSSNLQNHNSHNFLIETSEKDRGILEVPATSPVTKETEPHNGNTMSGFHSTNKGTNFLMQSSALASTAGKLTLVGKSPDLRMQSPKQHQLTRAAGKVTEKGEKCTVANDNDTLEKWSYMKKRCYMLQSKVEFEEKHFDKLGKSVKRLGESIVNSQSPLGQCAKLLAYTEKLVEQKESYCCQVCRDAYNKKSSVPTIQNINSPIKVDSENTGQMSRNCNGKNMIESENEPLWMQNFQPKTVESSRALKPLFEGTDLRMVTGHHGNGQYWNKPALQMLGDFNQLNQISNDLAAKQKAARMVRTPLYPDPK